MRTRRLVFALLCALCAALAAPAQVSLRIRLAHASVLDMEPAVVAVTISTLLFMKASWAARRWSGSRPA